jgi:RNA polymerase sigma-70 factor (ECF subfamily)
MTGKSSGNGKGFAAGARAFAGKQLAGSARISLSAAEERRLLAAARSGDRRAVRKLLGHLSGTVFRYGRSFCRNHHDAEDVLQDVLASLLRSLPNFRGEAALSTWAFVVARRTCARRRRREARFSSLESDRGRPAHEFADPNASPARDTERRQLGAALEGAIATLPEAQRDVLILRDVEGRSAAEVAKALKLGERAVKSRLHRARLALRDALAPSLGMGPAAKTGTGSSRSRGAGAAREGGDAAAPSRAAGCPDTARIFSRFLEGEIDNATCARMEAHVAECPSCGAACRTLRAAIGSCREWGGAPVPRETRELVRAAIRRVLEGEPFADPAPARAGRTEASARG